jgi:endonuclease/exonuclease/phosphatase family metal-dependent hydrolase
MLIRLASSMFSSVLCILFSFPTHATEPLRVMTFNVRYGTAKDGENHWDKRKEFLVETIKAFDPDLLGTQETLGFQRDFLSQQLAGYGVAGVGRDDGKEQGEMMALYFKQARFEKLGEGHFWLSETPDVVGSKGWDTSLPRMATWVRLQDRENKSASPILFVNTHFDHMGRVARLESAKLLRQQIESLASGAAVILTGDFNSGDGSEPYKSLFSDASGKPSPVIDAYRAAHPDRKPNEGTSTPFDVTKTTGSRIDWIAVSRDWKIVSIEIDRTHKDGRTPSDHFPVKAVLER